MDCCPSSYIQFAAQAVTTAAYTPAMRASYGATPRVTVYYLDPATGNFINDNGFAMAQVAFDPAANIISVDNGGVYSGILKIN